LPPHGGFSGDWAALALKLVLGTMAFGWVLWTVRAVNPRAVAMTLTFPALNGIVLLTVTDKVVSEMVIAIFPLMFFNGFLPSIFVVLRRRLAGDGSAFAVCLAIWAVIAASLEWDALQLYRWPLAIGIAVLILIAAGWAFQRLRLFDSPMPPQSEHTPALGEFLRARAARIALFFVTLLIVTLVATIFRDASSLVGRLSALPLIPLFVLHLAMSGRRADLVELRVAALIGPVVAMGFLIVFGFSLSLIRSDAGELHRLYWPVGLAMLLAEWELARRAILVLSRLTYRA
jgi:hypothetical protein